MGSNVGTRRTWKILSASVAIAASTLSAQAQRVTPTPETGVTPNVLLLYRADITPGRETDYSQREEQIAAGFEQQRIPVYWQALQSLTGPANVVYFDGFDSFLEVEKTQEVLTAALSAQHEIAEWQRELRSYTNASSTVLAFRRDDLGYRINKVDISRARYVRVTQVQLKTGTDEQFAEAVRSVRHYYEANDVDAPWVIYQVDSGMGVPTYFQLQPMQSLQEMDDAYDRAKNLQRPVRDFLRQRLIQTLQASLVNADAEIYKVSPRMSHVAPSGETSQARPERQSKESPAMNGDPGNAVDVGEERPTGLN